MTIRPLDRLTEQDAALLLALQDGLPLTSRPYADLGQKAGYSEQDVIERLAQWRAEGIIRRLGVIVRHRPLGYAANAMVVWDVPDDRVSAIGELVSRLPYVTLCYRRPRRGPAWPYNLFCMIHGKDRSEVERQIEELTEQCELKALPRSVLFSRRCFKQRGARYLGEITTPAAGARASE